MKFLATLFRQRPMAMLAMLAVAMLVLCVAPGASAQCANGACSVQFSYAMPVYQAPLLAPAPVAYLAAPPQVFAPAPTYSYGFAQSCNGSPSACRPALVTRGPIRSIVGGLFRPLARLNR